MMPLMIRGIIIYVVVISSVRLMGKRQIGELQPAELVITILLSEVAALPLQDSETPLIQSLVAIFLLVALEVIFSVAAMKSRPFRTVLQGHSVMVIKNGKIVQENMKLIRYSVDDIIEALRLKDVFDISEVDYAYIETNGSISVLLKKENQPVTVSDAKLSLPANSLSCLVISDGKIVANEFGICNLTENKLNKILSQHNLNPKDVLMMTYSSDGKSNIVIRKENL
ncbi:MAG: DUF421 domain-containing protein [Faecalibacterium sp.]|nr:DUF421 domain-containing protein [Ruminococcus sp.]MCM1391651.1 DUF421 domain-containing protein [Ruminococcus sp.]MCM1485740.1 DUF421 domain-containing protein [Faecalibacterium sp.]